MLNTEVFQKPDGEWTYHITYQDGRSGYKLLVGGLLKYRLPDEISEPISKSECKRLARGEREELTRQIKLDSNRFKPFDPDNLHPGITIRQQS